jgi:para-nitrobenzyl esterase
LSTIVSGMFVAFARTGDPNMKGLPAWPAFDLERRPTMIFDRHTRVDDDPRGRERRMFGQVPYVQPGT